LAKCPDLVDEKPVLQVIRPCLVGVVIAHLGSLAAQRLSGGPFQDTQI
jgi:hypothetical protein